MLKKLKFGWVIGFALINALASQSFAGRGEPHPAASPQPGQVSSRELGTLSVFSKDLRRLIFSGLNSQDLDSVVKATPFCAADAYWVDQSRWQQKVARIEAIMEKYGHWIDLLDPEGKPTGKQIASFPTVQELGVELLGKNPSKFKEKKYCPETYKEVVIQGEVIPMCPDFPMDRVIGENEGKKDSDQEIIALLNQAYRMAGRTSQFDSATREEWNYADTAGGTQSKLHAHAELPHEDLGLSKNYRAEAAHGFSISPVEALACRNREQLAREGGGRI